ncbi:BTAD domain-containing putative transcriptional regulator [Oscillospiraceae bacterium LTW-04]|nr:BTAD domain-containing putative transcriptional regulator [Oscillospiraceae bacterium MB24-C1]
MRVSETVNKSTQNKELRISMLGRFELQVDDVSINDGINRSRKMWNLLAYIVSHRDKLISQQEFINALWGDESGQNPINALKTLLYRIRLLLTPLEKAYSAEFILSQRGSYSWNSAINCKVDVDEFEALCRRAADEKLDDMKRISLYREAMDIYRGDFLPKLSMEFWAIPLSVHYHSLYLTAVKRFVDLLDRNALYIEISQVCTNAIAIDPLDEDIHCMQIRALLRQGKNSAALSQYEKATDILYRNLGIKPSEALRRLYVDIMRTNESLETDLSVIQDQLREAVSEPGAFVCEYGFFKEAYRLEIRRAARSGLAVFIGLFTVYTDTGEIPELPLLNVAMDQLLEAIKLSLRKGDVVSRYSGMQYVVMLPTLTYEDGDQVMNRIVNNFYKQIRRKPVKLHYRLQQLELPEEML